MAQPQADLIFPASDFYLAALRAGTDPFQALVRFADERDFATCALVELEVCRRLRDPGLQQRCRAGFACMVRQRLDEDLIGEALRLAEAAPALPLTTLLVAACAQKLGATVLTEDARFRAVPALGVISSLG